MWYECRMKYDSATKKEIMLPIGKWMELESIRLHEVSQTEKDKCYTFSLKRGT
jgi:hypothetical protein